jgi:hypothetical protein
MAGKETSGAYQSRRKIISKIISKSLDRVAVRGEHASKMADVSKFRATGVEN